MDSLRTTPFSDRIPIGPGARLLASAGAALLAYAFVVPLFASAQTFSPALHLLLFMLVFALVYFWVSANYCLRLKVESTTEGQSPAKWCLTIQDPSSRFSRRIAFEDIQEVHKAAYLSSTWRLVFGLRSALPCGVTSSVSLPDYEGDALIITYRYESPFDTEPQRVVLQLPCRQSDKLLSLLPHVKPVIRGVSGLGAAF